MKTILLAVALVGLGLSLSVLGGCETSRAGVKDTAGRYSTMVNAAPDKATAAAKQAVEDLKLADITSTATKVDGKVTARTAGNDQVNIEIEQAGDNVSEVSVRVGVTGDESLSMQILDRIKNSTK